MFLNLYEQATPVIDGNGVVRLDTAKDLPEHVVIEVLNGPAYITDDQVQKLIAYLTTWRQFRIEGTATNPDRPVFEAGR